MNRVPYIEPDVEGWMNKFKFKSEIKVRFGETDAFGHVNNVSYFRYFEQARLDYFEHLGFMNYFTDRECPSIIVTGDLHCHYLQPIYYGQVIAAHVRTAKIGRTSLDLQYALTDESGKTLFAACRGVMIHVDKHTEKSRPWPEEVKRRIIEFEPIYAD